MPFVITHWINLVAMVFLIFTLLYTPCVAAISTIRNEMGGRGAAIAVVVLQCVIAWFIAFLTYQLGLLLGLA